MRPAMGWAVLCLAAAAPPLSASSPSLHHRAHHTMTGEVVAYDPVARTLTLRVKSGSTVFHVAGDAKAWVDQEALPLGQLAGRRGSRATVTYTEKAGEKTTRTIRFTGAVPPHRGDPPSR